MNKTLFGQSFFLLSLKIMFLQWFLWGVCPNLLFIDKTCYLDLVALWLLLTGSHSLIYSLILVILSLYKSNHILYSMHSHLSSPAWWADHCLPLLYNNYYSVHIFHFLFTSFTILLPPSNLCLSVWLSVCMSVCMFFVYLCIYYVFHLCMFLCCLPFLCMCLHASVVSMCVCC